MAILSLISDNKLKLQCSFLEKDLAKKISGAYYNRDEQCWLYSFSKDRLEAFRKYFTDIEISAEVLEAEKKESEYIKQLLELKSLKKVDFDDSKLSKRTLFEHQKVAVNYLFNTDCAMLADELGLCKTSTSIVVSQLRKFYKQIKKVLVLCPATTKYTVWAREIELTTDDKYLVVDGSKKEREEIYKKFLSDDTIFYLITNYESFMLDHLLLRNFSADTMAILDEVIYIKTKDAKRTKTAKTLKSKYRIGISGYPAANKIIDIWSQFDFLKPGLLGNYWNFLDKYTVFSQMKFGTKSFKQLSGYKNLDVLKEKIEPFYIRRLKKDCLSLPPKLYEEREVNLSGNLLKAYNEMKEDMRVTITSMQDEEIFAKANTVLTQLLRLSQLTCGFITDKNLKNPEFFKESPKTELLDEIVDEALSSDQKIVIWTRFRPFTFQLLKHYTDGFKKDGEFRQYKCCHLYGGMDAKEKDDQIFKFQTDKEYKIFIATVQSASLGITLHAASVEVFTDLSLLSPSTVIQSEDRLHRPGQKKTVTILKLIAKDTIDQHWLQLLKSKQKMSSLLFEDDRVEKLDKETLLELLE
jgi:SNF2 family DNA or RNA helicase